MQKFAGGEGAATMYRNSALWVQTMRTDRPSRNFHQLDVAGGEPAEAAEIGVDRSALSTQLAAGTIRLSTFLALATVLETDPADYLGQHAPAQRNAA